MAMENEVDCGSTSYYSVLGVSSGCSIEEIRRAYRKLAMQWHPDRWTRNPSLLNTAKRKFQEIQEAYSVLSDQRKRRSYDAGMYDPENEDGEGMSEFVQELVSLMAQSKEEKIYSLEELQKMLWDMAKGFDFTSWYYEYPAFQEHGCEYSKKMRLETNSNGSCLKI